LLCVSKSFKNVSEVDTSLTFLTSHDSGKFAKRTFN
jgi:hypothetical protein